MAPLLVADELHAYLVEQGVAVGPSTTKTTLPKVWLAPRDGPLAPRLKDGEFLEPATITLTDETRPAPAWGAEYVEDTVVKVTVRARQHADAILTQRRVRDLVIGDHAGGRELWQMHGVLVQYTRAWAPDQFVDVTEDGIYTRVQRVLFGVRVKSLSGVGYFAGG